MIPDMRSTTIDADYDMVESTYWAIPDDSHRTIDQQSRWLLRIILDRQKMLDKELSVEDVALRIRDGVPQRLALIYSDNNADEQVIRIRTLKTDKTRLTMMRRRPRTT